MWRSALNIKLKFLGGAGNVTGSSYLVETNGFRLLVDCGMYQEWDLKGRNWAPLPVPPKTIDAIVITHAHLDHCGNLPKLVNDGFRGKVYCTEATADIARIILLDSARIQEEDAEFKKRRHQRENRKPAHPEAPLYTVEDAEASFPLFRTMRYGDINEIGEGVKLCFRDAGHVLGSSMVRLEITQGNETRTIAFSGDLGKWDRPILRDPGVFRDIDYVLVEGTYGDKVRDPSEEANIAANLAEVVNTTYRAGGNIIIPSFALQRSQEVLYHLNDLLLENQIPHIMVFLDSPMAVKITEVFKRHFHLLDSDMQRLIKAGKSPFDFPSLKMVESVDDSKAINHIKGTVIVIAGSGMCTGGRVKHHLVANITRQESTILFVGYQAIGTLGRQIVDGKDSVRILGQYYPVNARIIQLNGFSSHADRDVLVRWLSALERAPRKVFVIHGEADVTANFSAFLRNKTGWNVVAPSYQDEVILD